MRRRRSSAPCWTFRTWNTWRSDCWWTGTAGGPPRWPGRWGARYTEIMVDEYQDTNQVQNTIFQALSQEGRNLFMVGDVKQSIYRFRLADPTIFLEKYRTFPPYDQAQVGQERRITLSKNFRSRPQVLEAANDLFRAIMSRRLGEMDYTDGEALYPGGTFPAGEGYETEFHVLDFTEDPAYTEEKQNRNALEARFVAKEIAELLQSGFPVSDGAGGTRPVRPDDIAILLRSPGPVRRYYTQALEEQGVGWSAEEGGDLFAASEVSVALSWLQIIDNPQQDIPLLAVLRSPLGGDDRGPAGGDSRPGGGHLLHRPSGGRGAGVGGLPVLSGPAGSPAVWGGRGEQSSPALVFVPADRYAGGVFLPARRGKAPGESTLLL